jgi:hypothetical protein
MNVLMVRAKIKEEDVTDAQAAIEKVIQALEQEQFPAYQEMVENLKQWYAEPPAVEHMTVTGSYGLF